MLSHKFNILLFCNIVLTITWVNSRNILKSKTIICMDYISLLETGRTATKTIDIVKGTTVFLICRFWFTGIEICKYITYYKNVCAEAVRPYKHIFSIQLNDENTSFRSINWRYKMRGEKRYKDINQRTIYNYSLKNISLRHLDTLEIKFFSVSNSGIYICNYMDVYYEGIFVYVLDEVFNDSVPSVSGSVKEWDHYKEKYLDSINRKFENTHDGPFFSIAKLKFTFKLVASWGEWGQCEQLTRNKGVRKKIAKCLLHPYLRNNYVKDSDVFYNLTQFFCEEPYDVYCRSIQLSEKLPDISKLTRYIPYFEFFQECDVLKAYSPKKIQSYKYTIVKYIAESGHITLQCPEITIESRVEWYKDGYHLNSTFRNNLGLTEEEPHISIDLRNSLYILHASKREEGTYVCFIDGVRKQSYRIKVVSMSRLLNQEFFRYSIYLGFVLSLTLACYCTGIFVAWHRRTSFLDPLNMNN